MGIPWEIAKLGVRQGMAGSSEKDRARVASLPERKGFHLSNLSVSIHGTNQHQISPDQLISAEESTISSEADNSYLAESRLKRNLPKLVIAGGAVAVACSPDRGLLTKAVLVGVARRLAKIGKKG